MAEKIPVHPVAPRLKSGLRKPHIEPDIHAYRDAYKQSLGHESNKWWAKVVYASSIVAVLYLTQPSKLTIYSTGTALSRPYEPVGSPQATLSGSLKGD
jgi:hypothetical protein